MSPDPLALIQTAYDEIDRWERSFGEAPTPPALQVDEDALGEALEEYLGRMTAPPRGEAPGMYPFGNARYAGQMLKPPHPVALAAYAAAARINPNNHALDGGPPTSAMEKEVVADLARMFGFPSNALGHLTGGGTVANLEALFVAREETGGAAVAYSAEAHYTHARMAHVLDVEAVSVAADDAGRIDLDALEDTLKRGGVGTVVLTAATTGLGAVDPIADAIPLCRRYGARVHVDAAYGGFFRLLAAPPSAAGRGGAGPGGAEGAGGAALAGFPARHFRAIADADSVVVDPHKHGLQPYGCGAVLFRDPSVGRHYRHDSPYTYFTSDALHLGEISLECSRPGAAAGALWLTLRVLPLEAERGIGPIVAAGLRAARALAGRLDASDTYDLVLAPETDIVVYAPRAASVSETDARSGAVFEAGMADPDDPLFLSLYRLDADRLAAHLPALARDPSGTSGQAADHARVLRSVLMKPEHEAAVGWIADRLEGLAGGVEG
ncbi:pyridoxal phosphate-dependent decarboxylase family protein [Rubrivirga litoralis]|uniref:Aminotransferase class V-fold PLP-dependent enzyme n=1 Tax=Rubrivirga litoralis TaxID=3075598 RepID=A0ABU3BTW7_9BACT|nr:aminotransferase class V-fold PLP-dependent enzyme [Rubrivirga sp. F394]MDT0632734.1 aminotransferase class V-fold PLP-dependent enzyme [Rubrivirga sp. F394]